MRYIDKYPGCQGCPVSKYCGTMVSCSRLCNSYKEPDEKPVLTLSEAVSEEDYIESRTTMWDNITD